MCDPSSDRRVAPLLDEWCDVSAAYRSSTGTPHNDDARSRDGTQAGFFVIADISGYFNRPEGSPVVTGFAEAIFKAAKDTKERAGDASGTAG